MTGAGSLLRFIAPITVFKAVWTKKMSLTATVFFLVILCVLLLVGYRWRRALPNGASLFYHASIYSAIHSTIYGGIFFSPFLFFSFFRSRVLWRIKEGRKKREEKIPFLFFLFFRSCILCSGKKQRRKKFFPVMLFTCHICAHFLEFMNTMKFRFSRKSPYSGIHEFQKIPCNSPQF